VTDTMQTIDDAGILDLLSAPLLEEKPWATFAACRGGEGMTFFPQGKAEEEAALAVCAVCPVREECLDHALATNERFGIWGGTTEKQRRALARL
jgi:WhiB family redox-sensing transcriptional regulator